MALKNVEIKARCSSPDKIRSWLEGQDAVFQGVDHQVDTYFNIEEGRLKLRQGNIEQNLIFYRRPDTSEPKTSNINLSPVDHPEELLALLTQALGVQVVVDKKRHIYFINNVKFHIDKVKELGSFVEIEAIDRDQAVGEVKLRRQCRRYMHQLGISKEDLVSQSYSDLLINKQSPPNSPV